MTDLLPVLRGIGPDWGCFDRDFDRRAIEEYENVSGYLLSVRAFAFKRYLPSLLASPTAARTSYVPCR